MIQSMSSTIFSSPVIPAVGFKEWALVCEALGNGSSSLVLRKGGIAEGREGMRFQNEAFYLLPTLFHEQLAKTRLPADTRLPEPTPGEIQIRLAAEVQWTRLVTDFSIVEKLEPFHILHRLVVEERFRYDDTPGINVAFLKIWKLDQPWVFPDAPKYGGCRSWVNLPEPPKDLSWTSVLDDAENGERSEELLSLVATGL